MEKLLQLKVYVDGGINDTPFPNADDPIVIGEFRYDAKRMGGAPTITASVNYPSCLDKEWTDNVYAEFNGEKYYLKQTPTSSYSNESTMYKHDVVLVSERVNLDNVYFFDAVVGDPQGDDKPVSNSTKVMFFGDIREFVARLNSSLEYSGLDYRVVVDEEIETEEKLMSFEDKFFSNVLQEIYNTYEVPYYFDGKTIHIGWAKSDVVIPTLGYGVDDALLSIAKNNANYKVVNRATATGSSDNIPFYYPNNSPKGDVVAEESEDSQLGVKIFDYERFVDKVAIGGVITYQAAEADVTKVIDSLGNTVSSGNNSLIAEFGYRGFSTKYKMYITSYIDGIIPLTLTPLLDFERYDKNEDTVGSTASGTTSIRIFSEGKQLGKSEVNNLGHTFDIPLPRGMSLLEIHVSFMPEYNSSSNWFKGGVGLSWATDSVEGWYYEGEEVILKDLGLSITREKPYTGDTITQKLVKYVKTSQNLMPSVYRETDGAERFYNATNDTYEGVEFNNPYVEGHPKEHIFTVEDIKPTIKETEVNGLRIDMFSEFAYDEGDNDETYEDEEGNVYFKHPYFYGKLRIMDFNLFDHAIEQQPMTISFTSGDAGACNFEIGVTEEYPQKNPVQVYEDGTLKRDENGMVLAGVEGTQQLVSTFQDRQQDTSKYEVWIALRKEENTYGILMPKAPKFNDASEQIEAGHRPKACSEGQNDGDTFVILGINLPQSYILNAEKKLEAEIIKYLQDNNNEKFTFSIGFSRIYFEENEAVLNQLSENSKIRITYDDKPYDLYVSSFSYNMSSGDVLPEIRVELDDTLKVSQNALQNAISQVKSELGRALGNIDVVGAATPYFIRKDADDEAQGRINFKKGVKFGEGGKVEILDNNSAKLTIEYLEVTKKASFTSLEIQEKTHVGGQILVTPAAINCGEVEELDNAYRCYFQTQGTDGDEIFNQFVVGDQAICQTYNAWGSKYYWRLVTGIGEDYIDLSKVEGEYDEDSDAPSEGDKIIQLGNQTDAERQNAIVIAAYGDGSPYIIQYKGINAFEIPDDKIVTKLSSTENIFTGKVHMELGSTIPEEVLGNLDETISNAIGGLEFGKYNLLRNSGFTGDFVTESLDNGSVLDEDSQMFSDPLRHWSASNVAVQDSAVGQSGKEIVLTSGILSQELHDKIISGENYVLSFRGKGVSFDYSVGGVSGTVALDDQWTKVVHKFTATSDASTFAISNANATICDLQLERGTVQSAWGHSMWDNQSELAKYQSMQYLEAAMRNGSTDVLGGLILTNLILLGNPEASDNNAGISGIRNDDNDVAFWGGGTYAQAIDTVMKYVQDPTYQPTDEEVSSMAKAVITHGGRAILNDIILRGMVYAKGGSFGDLKIGKYVNACGTQDLEDSIFSELKHVVGEVTYSTTMKIFAGMMGLYGSHFDGRECFTGNIMEIDADSDTDKNSHNAIVYLRGGNIDAMKIEAGDIVHTSGQYRGLRVPTKVVTDDYTVDTRAVGVVIADTTNGGFFVYVPIPYDSMDGAQVEIYNVGSTAITINTTGLGLIFHNGTTSQQIDLNPSSYAKLVFSVEGRKWYMITI